MAIDVLSETLIDLRAVCRLPPYLRNGKPAHIATPHRHVLHGARDANGGRVKLEVVRTPSGLRTSREAVARFIEQLTRPDACAAGVHDLRTSRLRSSSIAQADQELTAAGI